VAQPPRVECTTELRIIVIPLSNADVYELDP